MKQRKKLTATEYQKIGKLFVKHFGEAAKDVYSFAVFQAGRTEPDLARLLKSLPLEIHTDLTRHGNLSELNIVRDYLNASRYNEKMEMWPAALVLSGLDFFHRQNYFDAIYELIYAYKYITLLWVLEDLKKEKNISIEEEFYTEAIITIKQMRARQATKKRIENANNKRNSRDSAIRAEAEKIGWNKLGLFQMADEIQKLPTYKNLSSESIRDSLRRLGYRPRKSGKKKTKY